MTGLYERSLRRGLVHPQRFTGPDVVALAVHDHLDRAVELDLGQRHTGKRPLPVDGVADRARPRPPRTASAERKPAAIRSTRLTHWQRYPLRRLYTQFVRLRDLPSVDELVRDIDDPLAVATARAVLERAREEIRAGADPGDLRERLAETLAAARRPALRRVLNATGVLVHTNLGPGAARRGRARARAGGRRLLEPGVRPLDGIARARARTTSRHCSGG